MEVPVNELEIKSVIYVSQDCYSCGHTFVCIHCCSKCKSGSDNSVDITRVLKHHEMMRCGL
jgi:hypothetical protein